jgi:hypothetical protein
MRANHNAANETAKTWISDESLPLQYNLAAPCHWCEQVAVLKTDVKEVNDRT